MPPEIEERESDVVFREFHVTTKSVNVEARTVDVIMSTDDLDRYEERVVQNWKLDSYAKNPVVLWAHMSRELPIGRCENVKMEDGKLVGTIKFASEKANPLAEQCLQLFAEKVLNAVSVGFIPHSYRFTKEEDREILELDDNELVELSATPTPANPAALVRMRAKALAARAEPQATPAKIAEVPTKKEIAMNIEQQLKDLQAKYDILVANKTLVDSEAAKTADTAKQLADKLVASEKALEAEKAKFATISDRCGTLETERAAQQKRADDLQTQVIGKELDELVGVKIAPAEKPGLIKLFAVDSALYAEHLVAIKARPDMKMLGTPVVQKDPSPAPGSTANPDATGDDFEREVQRSLPTN